MSDQSGRRVAGLQILAVVVLWLLVLLMVLCYVFRFPWAFAVTFWPIWIPSLLFMPISLIPILRFRKLFWAACAFWLALNLGFSEDLRGMLRSALPIPHRNSAVQIVSLNCAGGSLAAAEEALAGMPDVALLQESPGRVPLRQLVDRVYGGEGDLAWGVDGCVIVRGRVVEVIDAHHNFTAALCELADGSRLRIVSLRLAPPVARFDFWNPACWAEYARSKQLRREEFAELWQRLSAADDGTRLVLGGDFNSTPDHVTFAELEGEHKDVYNVAGRGWGATGINTFPVVRIDQIWVSDAIEVTTAGAAKTEHSDHRIVFCEVTIP